MDFSDHLPMWPYHAISYGIFDEICGQINKQIRVGKS